jgi:ATP-dependent exoDNAse (exonuclease V) beta subunit
LNKPIWEEVKNKYGKPDFGKLNIHFKQNKVRIQYVANRYGSFADNPDVITLTTYHSSKGLDFDTVLLPGCSNYAYSDSFEDRTLLMVGMTRTRKNLYISHAYGGWDSSILKFMDQKDLYHYEDEEGGKLLFQSLPCLSQAIRQETTKQILTPYLNDYEQLYTFN